MTFAGIELIAHFQMNENQKEVDFRLGSKIIVNLIKVLLEYNS